MNEDERVFREDLKAKGHSPEAIDQLVDDAYKYQAEQQQRQEIRKPDVIDPGNNPGAELALRQREKLDLFNRERRKLLEAKDRLGATKHILNYITGNHPKQIMIGIISLLLLGVFIHYLPVSMNWMIKTWMTPEINADTLKYSHPKTILNGLYALGGTSLILLVLLGIIFLFSGQVVRTWVKAGILKRPILQLWTKNRTIQFIVPKEVSLDMWTISEHSAVVPDPDAIVPGPHNLAIMSAIPELGFGFNPRNLLHGMNINIDMTVIKEYAEQHEARAREAMRTGMDMFKPLILPVAIAFVMMLLIWPIASQRMDQSNTIKGQMMENARLRSQLIENGITPHDMREDEMVEGLKPAQPGAPESGTKIK